MRLRSMMARMSLIGLPLLIATPALWVYGDVNAYVRPKEATSASWQRRIPFCSPTTKMPALRRESGWSEDNRLQAGERRQQESGGYDFRASDATPFATGYSN
jgi:hypothetical protein